MKEYMTKEYGLTVVDAGEVTEFEMSPCEAACLDANRLAPQGWEILVIVPDLHSVEVFFSRDAAEAVEDGDAADEEE